MKDVLIYKDFIGSVHYNADDHVFYGKIEGINDLVTFEGETVDNLESAFRDMVNQHIADCEAEGQPAKKSYKGVFNVRLSPELHRKAARIAVSYGITLNQFVRKAIIKEIEGD